MIKQKLTALFAAVVMSSAVLADDLTVQPVSFSHANAFDESKVFEIAPNQSLNAVELSESQMKETEGEFGPVGAVIGAIGGAAGYMIECTIKDCDFDTLEFLERTGSSAVASSVMGPAGVIWTFNGNIAYSSAKGVYYRLK